MDIKDAGDIAHRMVREMNKAVIGQDEVLEQMVVALLAGGHGLLEGVPGTAKTLLARTLSYVTGASFQRVQFTPDLMPSDIMGVNIYNTATGEFVFRQGPVFTDILLADEINRAPAKTQSALLEAMEEKQSTVDGVSHPMSSVFTVFATQNPVEFEGTYPLPEAQVDRFMLKILVKYPDQQQEANILDKVESGFDAADLTTANLETIVDTSSLERLRGIIRQVRVEEMVRRYITQIIQATRSMPQVALGASPRAGVMLLLAAKAHAVVSGKEFVTPDNVKTMSFPVLRHRILLNPEIEVEGKTSDDCLKELLLKVEVPR
ncbi:MAG: magnesium chelatase [Phycisphaerae bacterium SM23_30]|nr:MAG: magnesium chelatase [Phycisphaerae bacterium SM23_30]